MFTHHRAAGRTGRALVVALVIALGASITTTANASRGAVADPRAAGMSGVVAGASSDGPLASPAPSTSPEPMFVGDSIAPAEITPGPSPAAEPSATAPAGSPTTAPSTSPKPAAVPVATPSPSPSPSAAPTKAPSATPSPTPSPSPTPTPPPPLPAFPARCVAWSSPIERANLLLVNRYQLGGHPVVTLSSNPTWREDPLRSANWVLLHHSLLAVQNLMQAYSLTGDVRYRDRAVFLIRDWMADNPRSNPPAPFSWNDHATALRANVLACAWIYLRHDAWLVNALHLHGVALADANFYVKQGNHALDQSIGLLEVGGVLRRGDWMRLAQSRIAALLPVSVDSQGVTNEQSVYYQNYNRVHYTLAEERLRAWGQTISPDFARIKLMPNMLAHATRPDGRYEMIGDTDLVRAAIVPGTIAEFAATQGRSGPRPPTSVAVYRAGYIFTRTGWGGTNRPIADERYLSLRFGPAPFIHGHADGGSIRLYGYGTSLLVDPGGYTYNQDKWRTYFKGRTAHNVVTVDGVPWDFRSHTTLAGHLHSSTMTHARIYQPGNPGVSHERRVTFSRRLGYTLVEDRLASSATRRYRQLWHLPADGKPLVSATSFTTQRGYGNLQVRQLVGGSTSRVVIGQTSPVQGWVAYRHGEKAAAPVVEVMKSGQRVRFVTLLVTAAGAPRATVSNFGLTADGYRVTVTIGGKSERVVVSGTTASITPLN